MSCISARFSRLQFYRPTLSRGLPPDARARVDLTMFPARDAITETTMITRPFAITERTERFGARYRTDCSGQLTPTLGRRATPRSLSRGDEERATAWDRPGEVGSTSEHQQHQRVGQIIPTYPFALPETEREGEKGKESEKERARERFSITVDFSPDLVVLHPNCPFSRSLAFSRFLRSMGRESELKPDGSLIGCRRPCEMGHASRGQRAPSSAGSFETAVEWLLGGFWSFESDSGFLDWEICKEFATIYSTSILQQISHTRVHNACNCRLLRTQVFSESRLRLDWNIGRTHYTLKRVSGDYASEKIEKMRNIHVCFWSITLRAYFYNLCLFFYVYRLMFTRVFQWHKHLLCGPYHTNIT